MRSRSGGNALAYAPLDAVDRDELLALLNQVKIRRHLIDHAPFDAQTLNAWIDMKQNVSSRPGCRVRAVMVNGRLAGWCGLQCEAGGYEIAIVLDDAWWGVGPRIFRDLMGWAKDFGHRRVLLNLLATRREYRFLRRIAVGVRQRKIRGQTFTVYELAVN